MSRKKNTLKVVEGGPEKAVNPAAEGCEYLCSKLHVACVIDVWKNGRKVDEFISAGVPVMASAEGETAFGENCDKLVNELLTRMAKGDLKPAQPE